MDEKQIAQLLADLRKANEQLVAGQGVASEHKEKISKIEKALEANEAENAKLVAAIAAKDKAAGELKDRIDGMEKTLKRFPNGSTEVGQASMAMKAFEKYVHYGAGKLTDDERKLLADVTSENSEIKTLSTDVDPDSGYLAPAEYLLEILKKITLISPVRQFARVRKVSAPSQRMFRRDTLVTSYWTGEAKTFVASNSKYAMPEIPLHSLTGEVNITTKDLFGSAFNMENEINLDLIEEFARAESESFVTGNGKSKPSGFTLNSDIEVVNSGVANGIVADNFDSLYGKIKTGYKPIYGMNRLTISVIRKMKDSMGRYLFEQGNLAAGIPNQIKGDPYVEMPHMPDIGANLYPIVYGDFSKGYQIVDGLTLAILRNPYRTSGLVIFTAERFVGGQVVMPEALKLLKCSL